MSTAEVNEPDFTSIGQVAAKVVEQAAPRQDMTVWDAQHRSVTPLHMLDRALASGASLEMIEKLMALQERHEANEARKAFNEAFAAFKSEAVTIVRSKKITDGPLKGKSYAELYSFVDAVAPALSKHGLSHSWDITRDEEKWIEVTCSIEHALGFSKKVKLGGPPDAGGAKNPLQARISTITYLERATLKAACGLAEQGDDTDGRVEKIDNGPISDEQVAKVRALIKETSTDEPAFLKWLDVGKIEDIPASQMKRVEDSFAAKKRRLAS